ncbi:MAG: hypothetical protein WAW37_00165 [Syntrophobacteraceae bacterium]
MAKLNLIQACDKAIVIVSQTREMEKLYQKALQCLGEGRLRCDIMNRATEAIEDDKLCEEVFVSNENMVSFLCGIWIQFLLVEVAGVKKDKLKTLAQKAFPASLDDRSIH